MAIEKNDNQIAWNANPEAGTRKTIEILGVKLAFHYCPPGSFTMGSPSSETGRIDNPILRFFHDTASPETPLCYALDEIPFRATLTNGFWMQETPITQATYKKVMGTNPSFYAATGKYEVWVRGVNTLRFPVEGVNWFDAQDFIDKINSSGRTPNGFEFRLPWEAEWEYACRAGTTGPYNVANPFGESVQDITNGPGDVGQQKPNAWGIFDMHGCVREWCADWYAKKYPIGSATNPTGPRTGSKRVLRGGGWCGNREVECRSASRQYAAPTKRKDEIGFRLVLSQY